MSIIKVILTVALLSVFAPLYAGYHDSIAGAAQALKHHKLIPALELYKRAYRERPSEKLKNVIFKLYEMIKLQDTPTLNGKKIKEKPFLTGSTILISTNVLLFGAAVGSIFYEQAKVKEYNTLYDRINATTPENYQKLLDKQQETYNVMILKSSVIMIFLSVLTYTAVDLFMTHKIFGQELSLNTGDGHGDIQLAVKRSF